MATSSPPLVRTGQGSYTRDYDPDRVSPKDFLLREPFDVYRAKADYNLSSHALADFRKRPLLYRRKKLGLIPDKDSSAYLVGRATHTLILEGRERYEAEYVVGGPIDDQRQKPCHKNSNVYKDWLAKQTKDVLSDSDAAIVEQMTMNVRSNIFACELLRDGVAEGVVRCTYAGQQCQARIDWFNPDPEKGIVDLKTTQDLDGFEEDAWKYGYVHQLAFYRAMVEQVTGRVFPVHLIAVEKRDPFSCGVWQIDPRRLFDAGIENEESMDALTVCTHRRVWPTGYESLRMLT